MATDDDIPEEFTKAVEGAVAQMIEEGLIEVSSMSIEPEWPNTLRWTATVMAQHGFEKNAYGPVASLLEMAVKVYHDDPATFQRIVEELEDKDKPVRITVHYHKPAPNADGSLSVTCQHCGKVILYVKRTDSWETPEWIKEHHAEN